MRPARRKCFVIGAVAAVNSDITDPIPEAPIGTRPLPRCDSRWYVGRLRRLIGCGKNVRLCFWIIGFDLRVKARIERIGLRGLPQHETAVTPKKCF